MLTRLQVYNGMTGSGDVPKDTRYSLEFINARTDWKPEWELEPSPLRPPLPTMRDIFYDGGDTGKVCWKGFCCQACGRLNCREEWARWVCKSCDHVITPERTIYKADRLLDPHRSIFTGPALWTHTVKPGVSFARDIIAGHTVLSYNLQNCGTVYHILASEHHNKGHGRTDEIFEEYQAAEMPFRRHPLKTHKCEFISVYGLPQILTYSAQGALLTQQFSFNAVSTASFFNTGVLS